MASALSLWLSGVRDIVIVEAAEHGNGNVASRAIVIHAATLEVSPCEHSGCGLSLHYIVTGARSYWLRRCSGRTRDQGRQHELL